MIEWWTEQQAGLVGGIGGGVIGILGAILGTCIGILGPRGKGRTFVLGLQITLAVAGAVLLVGGIAALLAKQPYHVYYPLLLGGGILVLLMVGLLPVTIGTYRGAEQRRIEAEQIRRGY